MAKYWQLTYLLITGVCRLSLKNMKTMIVYLLSVFQPAVKQYAEENDSEENNDRNKKNDSLQLDTHTHTPC